MNRYQLRPASAGRSTDDRPEHGVDEEEETALAEGVRLHQGSSHVEPNHREEDGGHLHQHAPRVLLRDFNVHQVEDDQRAAQRAEERNDDIRVRL